MLVAHALAYTITSTPEGSAHEYLHHAPQVLLLLALAALGLTAGASASVRRTAWPFALAGPLTFLLQEHLERAAHDGHVPWLLTTPAILVGLALQAPIGVLAALLARKLLGAVSARSRRRPLLLRLLLFVVPPVGVERIAACVCSVPFARGPPALALRPSVR